MTKKKAHKPGSATIALNKRARHEYFIEEEFEAGLALQGWEVKSLRAGKANISDSYVPRFYCRNSLPDEWFFRHHLRST